MVKRAGVTALVVCIISGCAPAALLAGAGIGGAGVYRYKGKIEKTMPYSVPRVHSAVVSGLKSMDIPITMDQSNQLIMCVGVTGDREYSQRIRDAIVKRL